MVTVYKIRDNATGLFSTGGTSPRWKKLGKVWKQKAHVSNHLGQYLYCFKYPDSAVVVEYEITENEAGSFSVEEWKDQVAGRRAVRDAAHNKRMAAWRAEDAKIRLERAQAEVDRLKREYSL